MKNIKRIISIFMFTLMIASLFVGCGKVEQKDLVLSASEAVCTGQGADQNEVYGDTHYDADNKAITNFGSESTITYTVPDGAAGTYDVYIDYGKSFRPNGTTQASLIINGEQEYVYPANIEKCESDFSDYFSMGKFVMAVEVELESGDTLTVQAKEGFENKVGAIDNPTIKSLYTPIGDMYLYPTGTEVAIGYDGGFILEEKDTSDALSGLTIAWLGSSVTFGAQSGGYTMADAIEDAHPGTTSYKFAISGTTLVNEDSTSYVERLKEIDSDMKMDLMIVQLSTNDATLNKELGMLASGTDLGSFDDTTVIGAIEYIIAYTKQTWDCPVVFYTGTYYESEAYASMVDALLQVQEKWDIGVVDLWNDEAMTALFGTEQYDVYMSDKIHPSLEGYTEWWTPKFETYLENMY